MAGKGSTKGLGVSTLLLWVPGVLLLGCISLTQSKVVQLSACKAVVRGRLINLEPLQSKHGPPRFHVQSGEWNYTFNPCRSYNLPADPYYGRGDQCHYVSMCRSRDVVDSDVDEFFILGIQRSARIVTVRMPHQPKHFPLVKSNMPNSGGGIEGNLTKEKPAKNHQLIQSINSNSFVREKITSSGNNRKEDSLITRGLGTEEYDDFEDEMDISIQGRLLNNHKGVAGRPIELTTSSSGISNKEKSNLATNSPAELETVESGSSPHTFTVFSPPEEVENSKEITRGQKTGRNRKRGRRKKPRVRRNSSDGILKEGTTRTSTRKVHYNVAVLKFRGMRSLRQHKSNVLLICDHTRVDVSDALFRFVGSEGQDHYFEVHHQCCCPDGCLEYRTEPMSSGYNNASPSLHGYQARTSETVKTRNPGSVGYNQTENEEGEGEDDNQTENEEGEGEDENEDEDEEEEEDDEESEDSSSSSSSSSEEQGSGHLSSEEDDMDDFANKTGKMSEIERKLQELERRGPRFMWIVLLVNVTLLVGAAVIGTVCCRKGGGHGPYNMLPAIHNSSRLTMNSVESYPPGFKSPELLDYSSSLHKSAQLPILDNCIIPARELEIGQRLGGGLFGDTYVADWKERRVAVTRITVGVHQNPLLDEDYEWLGREISYFSRQRHKNVVTVLGICLDLRHPYIVNAFIDGESLREIIHREESIPMTKLVKMCIQAADGMAFLHSAKYAVLHRDLRSANLLVDHKERVKVVDFGNMKLMQRLRTRCSGRKGCYCQKDRSAYPASIRWTAPEILANPMADEYHDAFTLSVDMYSFAMVLWEVASATDPFEDITDENEVVELVKAGHRPPVELIQSSVVPQYLELMKTCWNADPQERPSFKQVAVQLKSVMQASQKLEKHRIRTDSETTYYLRSALNLT